MLSATKAVEAGYLGQRWSAPRTEDSTAGTPRPPNPDDEGREATLPCNERSSKLKRPASRRFHPENRRSDELIFARNGPGRNRQRQVVAKGLRLKILLGVQHHLPGDFQAGIRGLAAHDTGERALCHAHRVIHVRAIAANAADESHVLADVRVLQRVSELCPDILTRAAAEIVGVRTALGAGHKL